MENHKHVMIGAVLVVLAAAGLYWYTCCRKEESVKVQAYNQSGKSSSSKYARYQSEDDK